MTHTATHTPQWELSSKHRDEQYIDEPLAEELRPLFRIHWDNNVSDTEAEQGATLIAAAPAMYTAIQHLLEWVKGNRGSKTGNPYCIPEVRHALKTLASIQGVKDYLDANTTVEGGL